MKWYLTLIVTLVVIVSCTSCMGNPTRRFLGTNVVGADVETARESTSAVIQSEVVQDHLKEITALSKSITKSDAPPSVIVAAETINKRSKESSRLVREIKAKLESIHHRSLGKTYWSKGKLFLFWLGGFVILGIAVRFVPFFQPVHRFISGVLNAIMDAGHGVTQAVKDMSLKHATASNNVDTARLPPELQAEIKKAEIRKVWVDKAEKRKVEGTP